VPKKEIAVGLFSGYTTLVDSAGYSNNGTIECGGDGFAYQNVPLLGHNYYGTDAWTAGPNQQSSPLTVNIPNTEKLLSQGFTAYLLYRRDNYTDRQKTDLLFDWSGFAPESNAIRPLAALVYDGTHFSLDTRVNEASYRQNFWEPDSPTTYSASSARFLDPPYSQWSPINSRILCYGATCIYEPEYVTWYHVFLTVTPDGRARLDVFNYDPNARSSGGKQYDWYESTLEGGVAQHYLSPDNTSAEDTKYIIGSSNKINFDLLASSFPSSWFSALPGNYRSPYLNMFTVFNHPLTHGELLAYLNQQMSRSLNSSSYVLPQAGGTPVTDSDINGGSQGLDYLYPCNSGRFLVRPTTSLSGQASIRTPCGYLTSPFTSPALGSNGSTAPNLQITPSRITFTSGQDYQPQTITILNQGYGPVNITGVSLNYLVENGPLEYQNGCTSTLPVGGNCSITVSWPRPTVTYTAATLNISAKNAPAQALARASSSKLASDVDTDEVVYSVNVTAQIPPPILVQSTTNLQLFPEFPDEPVTRTIHISNAGTTPLSIYGATIEPSTAPFTANISQCMNPIAQTGSCDLTVTYASRREASQVSGTLKIESNDPNSPDTVSLSAAPTALVATPNNLEFQVPYQTLPSGLTQTITIASWSDNLTITGVQIVQDASSAFRISSNTCIQPLPYGQTCTVTVLYGSPALRLSRANLIINTNLPVWQSYQIPIEGEMYPAAFSVDGATTFTYQSSHYFYIKNLTSSNLNLDMKLS
jgi:hypothetical protein